MYRCPHCNAELSHLCYSENATVYGSYDIETEDYEQEETEIDGGIKYFCPECDEIIDSVDDLINEEEEEETTPNEERLTPPSFPFPPLFGINREKTELPVPPAINQEWRGEYSGYHNSHDRQKQLYILVCSKCGAKNEILDNEEINCYHCNKKLNQINAKKVIPIENN